MWPIPRGTVWRAGAGPSVQVPALSGRYNRGMKKTLAFLLTFSLVALSPGMAPYAAAAGNVAGRGTAATGVPSLSIPSIQLPGAPLSLTAPVSLQTPSLALPALAVPIAASASAGPKAAPAQKAAAAKAQAAVSAAAQLEQGAGQILQAAAPQGSAQAGSAALDRVFSGSAMQAASSDAPISGNDGASFSPLGAPRRGGDGGGSGNEPPPAGPAPKQSLARSAHVGLLAAVIPMALTIGALIAAQALGYDPHPDYKSPFPEQMTAAAAVTTLIGATVMAPVSEELIFRGGIMGFLRAITKRVPKIGAFWIPATLSSLAFVAVHEMSDPLLFTTRFVHSMIMSYAFHKEGYTGSIFAHGFFNALAVAGLVIPALLPGALGTVAMLAMWPVAIGFSIRAARKLRAQKEDKASGRLAAFEVSPKLALGFAVILALGYFFLMSNQVWAVGAVGWLMYAYLKRPRAPAVF